MSVSAEIPDDVARKALDRKYLPTEWRAYPAPERLAKIGSAWARSLETAVLIVPSAVIPEEKNYLLNPKHPDAGRVSIVQKSAFSFDPRLRRRKARAR